MNDDRFRQILDRFELSWAGYRKVRKGVKKRVARHMQQLGCKSVQAYLDSLARDGEARKQAENALSVTISRFFRDRKLWADLETWVFSEIVSHRDRQVKAWSAGCACGEEVYSIKMLWDRYIHQVKHSPELVVWATDSNIQALNRARDGVYSLGSLKEVDRDLRDQYLRPHSEPDRFVVTQGLRAGIVWRHHDLLTDEPPADGFHLVFLRNNLLTYYREPRRKHAWERIVSSIVQRGFLVTGAHEIVPDCCEGMELSGFNRMILRKRQV
jgi:chemotaxis methyl-accepting protein methylase